MSNEARAELARWATWGTIEVAIRNPNVASYIEHWEKRALSAEAERDALRAAVEKCNGELGCKAYALLAPAAAAPLPGCGFANVPLSHGVAINSGAAPEAGAGEKP